jgi:rhomboid protease GluP
VLNPNDTVSVGASGAIMGLFAAMLILSTHFPKGKTRTGFQLYALFMLLPSLLPLASALKGKKIDYAAHFGGAIGGAIIALIILAVWRREALRPSLRMAALAVALVSCGGATFAAVQIRAKLPTYEFSAALAPREQIPQTENEMRAQSAKLVAQYPRDPRLHLLHAQVLVRAGDFANAERELRAGLAEESIWRDMMPSELSATLRALLALALLDADRLDEAKDTVRPVCGLLKTGPFRPIIEEQKLCDG